ncbi:adenylate/guanylate cyclase domain-containing protein [Petroclostridium sp. X23]|uniref:CHASE2 domain-containing protein n=1 Tax=Petroclostridium sp. X23 TaxID=3045146 RepID=UPI0024AC8F9E|nr:adenylate/guanylate cyclase domain-containing protein [Petroclostridium sp. X23]WHH61074.1 adenylate/guanylate cyclase domain-containing protein [Petroclostridium sp. X23]
MGAKISLKFRPVHIVLFILVVFVILSNFNSFESVESRLQDQILQTKDTVDSNIIIIGIDDRSLEKLGRWPWSRDILAKMIDKLTQAKAAVIGIDIMLSEKARDQYEDAALVEAVKNSWNVVVPVVGVFNQYTRAGEMKAEAIQVPFEELMQNVETGHINIIADKDGTVRKTLNSFTYNDQETKSFAIKIYEAYMKSTGKTAQTGSIPQDAWNRAYIDFAGGAGHFAYLSFYDVLEKEISPEYFQDAIVLIGPHTVGMRDAYYTPMDHNTPMYGVEIHANIIQNLLRNSFKQEIPSIANIFILIGVAFISLWFFGRLSPFKSVFILISIITVHIIASRLIYSKGYIVQLFYPMLLTAVTYLTLLAYRYIEELFERKRVTDVFGRYVAPQVVSQILQNGEEGLKLGGTRREITCLFVDIRGFTPLSEKAQPEEVVNILNDYLDLCAQSIFRYGGTLDKFIGDATMAIFNAPLNLEDHAFKAVQTAWAMKQGSEKLREALIKKFGRGVQFGIGINTGLAVVGNIGTSFRMDYTAIGDTVNTSARLESNAKPGQILLSQSTYELVKDRVLATALGEIKVKGKEQGIQIYQLEGVR